MTISLDLLSPEQRATLALIQQTFEDGEVFLVGGVVRDLLLRRQVGDVDVVVAGIPFDVVSSRLTASGRTDLVGKRFGVIKFKPRDGETIDVALPRTEHTLVGTGHRRDFDVHFDHTLPIEKDVERRDFTVNAMAARLNHEYAEVVDTFGGTEDLEKKLIRAVGNPKERFEEDFSRMMRALRFACELDFTIESKTWTAIQEDIAHLDDKDKGVDYIVPREVIAKETLRAFLGKPSKAFDLFEESGAFGVLMPELHKMKGCLQPAPWHKEGDVWQHTRLAMEMMESSEFKKEFGEDSLTAEIAIATLLHDIAKPVMLKTPEEHGIDRIRFEGHDTEGAKMASAICRRLKLTSYKADRIDVDCERMAKIIARHLIFIHGDPDEMRNTTIEKYFIKDPMFGNGLLALTFIDGMSTIHESGNVYLDHWYRAKKRIKEVRTRIEEEQKRGKPLLSGDEVMKILNLKPCPKVGSALLKLREAELAGELKSEEEAVDFVRSLNVSRPPLILISGPSGVGKTSVANGLLKRIPELRYVISCTTREPRQGEKNEKDYHFLAKEKFMAKVKSGEMIEWAEVYGDLYGRASGDIEKVFAGGFIPLVSVDVQGAKTYFKNELNIYSIFISPSNLKELRLRLEARGKDSSKEIEERLSKAEDEMRDKNLFDAVIVNKQDRLNEVVDEARKLVKDIIDKN